MFSNYLTTGNFAARLERLQLDEIPTMAKALPAYQWVFRKATPVEVEKANWQDGAESSGVFS